MQLNFFFFHFKKILCIFIIIITVVINFIIIITIVKITWINVNKFLQESIVIDGSSSDEETELQCKSTESVEHEEEARASEPLTSGNQSAELPLTCPNIEAVTNAASPVIVVDQEIYQDSQSESVASSTPLSYETESNISDYDKPPVVSPLTMEFIDPSMSLSKSVSLLFYILSCLNIKKFINCLRRNT